MRKLLSKHRFSSIALILVLLLVTWSQTNQHRWTERNVIIWDVIGYYSYLPALIYGDFTMEDETMRADFDYYAWGKPVPGRGMVIQMSSGTSVLYSPFFFTAYFIDILDGDATDLDSPLYHKAISLAAIFWLLFGLFFMAALLRRHFSDLTTAIVVFLMALATNIYHYSTAEPGMSHVYGFALFALFLWLAERWYDRQSVVRAIGLGLVLGLAVLIRPTNITLGLILVLPFFPSAVKVLLSRWYYLPIMAAAAVIVWLPQMFYWKFITGSWLYFSYNDSSFFFDNPQILKGLFSFRKGWFIYTPLMIFAFSGLFLKDLPKRYRLAIPVYLLANIYIILSWWCWWYGGAFGLRAFIESYTVLAIPLAALVSRTLKSKQVVKLVILTLLAAVLSLNLFQTYQYKRTLIHWDSMTYESYKAVFLKLKFPPNYSELIDEPDYENARLGLPEKDVLE